MRFLGCGTPPLTSLGNSEAYFLSGIKAFFIEHGGYNDLQRAAEGGHDAAAYLYAILLYRDNGGAATDDTAKGYMRRVAGGGSTTSSRWLSNEGCLPLREKAARALHYSTWHIWGELLLPSAQVRGDQPCAGTGGGCGVEKGWHRISLFCSEDCRLRCEMVKFAQGIGNQ
jgi:TPR repeat protein